MSRGSTWLEMYRRWACCETGPLQGHLDVNVAAVDPDPCFQNAQCLTPKSKSKWGTSFSSPPTGWGGKKTRRSHTRPELHFAQQPHLEENGAKLWQLHNSTKNASPWMKIFLRLTKFHLTEWQKGWKNERNILLWADLRHFSVPRAQSPFWK